MVLLLPHSAVEAGMAHYCETGFQEHNKILLPTATVIIFLK